MITAMKNGNLMHSYWSGVVQKLDLASRRHTSLDREAPP